MAKYDLLKAPIAHVVSVNYYKEALNAYLGTDEIEKLELNHDYVLGGLLPVGGYLHLYGREKSGKTRLAWQLARSVGITGRPWMGFITNRTGPVLWLELDMGTAEFKYVLGSAQAAGMGGHPAILGPGKHHYLNALSPQGQDFLYTLGVIHKPILTVVDTFTDCYEGELENEVIRRVVASFRFALAGSSFVFINHERRTSQALIAKDKQDTDAELGGGELSRKASGVLRLVRHSDAAGILSLKRIRTQRHWTDLGLRITEHGFWQIDHAHLTARMLIALWPDIPGLSMEEAKQCKSAEQVLGTLHKYMPHLDMHKLKDAYSQMHGELPWQRWLGLL